MQSTFKISTKLPEKVPDAADKHKVHVEMQPAAASESLSYHAFLPHVNTAFKQFDTVATTIVKNKIKKLNELFAPRIKMAESMMEAYVAVKIDRSKPYFSFKILYLYLSSLIQKYPLGLMMRDERCILIKIGEAIPIEYLSMIDTIRVVLDYETYDLFTQKYVMLRQNIDFMDTNVGLHHPINDTIAPSSTSSSSTNSDTPSPTTS